MTSSRRSSVEASKNIKAAVWYTILTIVLLFALIRWGVPGFINIIANVGGTKTNTAKAGFDIAPQEPVLYPLPDATFSGMINLSGVAEGNIKVRLTLNSSKVEEVNANDEGVFEFTRIPLIDGKNVISLVSINSKDKQSRETVATITLDNIPPSLIISSPEDGAEYFGTTKNAEITGNIKEEGVVDINGHLVYTNNSGDFTYKLNLNTGENTIVIKATDNAGNTEEKTLLLTYNP